MAPLAWLRHFSHSEWAPTGWRVRQLSYARTNGVRARCQETDAGGDQPPRQGSARLRGASKHRARVPSTAVARGPVRARNPGARGCGSAVGCASGGGVVGAAFAGGCPGEGRVMAKKSELAPGKRAEPGSAQVGPPAAPSERADLHRDLARALRGDLKVSIRPGEGSTFTLILPRAEPVKASPGAPPGRRPAPGLPDMQIQSPQDHVEVLYRAPRGCRARGRGRGRGRAGQQARATGKGKGKGKGKGTTATAGRRAWRLRCGSARPELAARG